MSSSVTSAEGLAYCGGRYLGEEVSVVRETLSDGRFADSRRDAKGVTIRVSPACTTVLHTVAHELGHLILEHSHMSVRCLEQDGEAGPPGFERLYLAFLSEGSAVDWKAELAMEEEAEFFASEVMKQLTTVNEPSLVRAWASGI